MVSFSLSSCMNVCNMQKRHICLNMIAIWAHCLCVRPQSIYQTVTDCILFYCIVIIVYKVWHTPFVCSTINQHNGSCKVHCGSFIFPFVFCIQYFNLLPSNHLTNDDLNNPIFMFYLLIYAIFTNDDCERVRVKESKSEERKEKTTLN